MCFLLQCLLDLHFQVSCVMVEAKPAAGQSVGWSLWPSEPFCWQGLDVDDRNSLTPQRRCGSFWFHFAQLHEGFLPYAVIFPELLEFVAFLFEQLVMFVSSDTEGKQHLTQRPAGWNITPFQSTAMHLKAADLCWSAFWVVVSLLSAGAGGEDMLSFLCAQLGLPSAARAVPMLGAQGRSSLWRTFPNSWCVLWLSATPSSFRKRSMKSSLLLSVRGAHTQGELVSSAQRGDGRWVFSLQFAPV